MALNISSTKNLSVVNIIFKAISNNSKTFFWSVKILDPKNLASDNKNKNLIKSLNPYLYLNNKSISLREPVKYTTEHMLYFFLKKNLKKTTVLPKFNKYNTSKISNKKKIKLSDIKIFFFNIKTEKFMKKFPKNFYKNKFIYNKYLLLKKNVSHKNNNRAKVLTRKQNFLNKGLFIPKNNFLDYYKIFKNKQSSVQYYKQLNLTYKAPKIKYFKKKKSKQKLIRSKKIKTKISLLVNQNLKFKFLKKSKNFLFFFSKNKYLNFKCIFLKKYKSFSKKKKFSKKLKIKKLNISKFKKNKFNNFIFHKASPNHNKFFNITNFWKSKSLSTNDKLTSKLDINKSKILTKITNLYSKLNKPFIFRNIGIFLWSQRNNFFTKNTKMKFLFKKKKYSFLFPNEVRKSILNRRKAFKSYRFVYKTSKLKKKKTLFFFNFF